MFLFGPISESKNVLKYYIKNKEECFIRCPNTEKWVEKNEAQLSFFNPFTPKGFPIDE